MLGPPPRGTTSDFAARPLGSDMKLKPRSTKRYMLTVRWFMAVVTVVTVSVVVCLSPLWSTRVVMMPQRSALKFTRWAATAWLSGNDELHLVVELSGPRPVTRYVVVISCTLLMSALVQVLN